jgi:Flp pilus assembly protein TadG
LRNALRRRLAIHANRARRFARNRRGNVAIIVAVMALVLAFAVGMGVDYTFAARRQEQINGFADAAALAAVTPNMMLQSSSTAAAAAQTMFVSQLATMNNVTYLPANVTVTATDTAGATKVTRTAVVTYTAGSTNAFSSLLGMASIPLSGSSTATSSNSPNTDFYMLLDTSPSMEIAATTAGINTMVSNTASQGGCAFGCHESDPAADNLGNPGGEDNYALARNLGVTLRIDLVNLATQNLMDVAQTTETQNNTTYRAAIYTMDYGLNPLIGITSNLASAKTAAANIQSLEVYNNNCLTSSNCNSDEDSYLDDNLHALNSLMPNPGNGTNAVGDTPQAVVMIVSDGVVDQKYNGNRLIAPMNTNQDWCDTVKGRNIRIAYLYLTYNPLPTNSFYVSNVAPFQSQISTDAQNCASSGLFFEVNTDGDVSTALATLFQKAVATARLVQ